MTAPPGHRLNVTVSVTPLLCITMVKSLHVKYRNYLKRIQGSYLSVYPLSSDHLCFICVSAIHLPVSIHPSIIHPSVSPLAVIYPSCTICPSILYVSC